MLNARNNDQIKDRPRVKFNGHRGLFVSDGVNTGMTIIFEFFMNIVKKI